MRQALNVTIGNSMNATQSRMARAALRWSCHDLAAASCVNRVTVLRFEGGQRVSDKTVDAMQTALEGAGVKFSRNGALLVVGFPDM